MWINLVYLALLKTKHMHIQETIIKDVQNSVHESLSNFIDKKKLEDIKEALELVVLNAFYKHGFAIGDRVRN